ncbi:hypothetical protein BRD07_08600 [Halobacteriales archaeon QS_9_68_42]|nr:MAG: hypothetical protein BRD07_08600 [Halobacteriales archaeon QS_9_68_42]
MALRRRTLLTTAAAVPLAATAGCTDGFGIGGNDDTRNPPEYARWVPARSTDDEETLFVYFDVSRLSNLQDFQEDLPTGDDPFGETPNAGREENVDALVGVPTFGAVFVGFALGLQLGLYGFVGELLAESLGVGGGPGVGDETGDEGSPTDEGDSELGTVETMLFTGETAVLEGSFDLEAIDDAAERFERSGEHRGTRIYEGTGDSTLVSTDGLAFAAREDALVFGSPPSNSASFERTPTEEGDADEESARPSVERALDVEAGEEDRFADRNDDADGGGLDETPESLGDARGEVYSLTLAETELTGEMAAVYPEEETPDREEVERHVGNTADEREVEVDDSRVSVTGTYTNETESGEEA